MISPETLTLRFFKSLITTVPRCFSSFLCCTELFFKELISNSWVPSSVFCLLEKAICMEDFSLRFSISCLVGEREKRGTNKGRETLNVYESARAWKLVLKLYNDWRYRPQRGLSSSYCGGLQPLPEAFFCPSGFLCFGLLTLNLSILGPWYLWRKKYTSKKKKKEKVSENLKFFKNCHFLIVIKNNKKNTYNLDCFCAKLKIIIYLLSS